MKRSDGMRRVICAASSLALAATMVVTVPGGTARAEDAVEVDGQVVELSDIVDDGEGEGIDSAAELKALALFVNGGQDLAGKTVALNKNLGLAGASLTPVGTKAHPFRGTFDGKNHTIGNFTLSGSQYVGLFGYVGAGGKVQNVTIGSEVSVSASSGSEVVKCVGSLAGYVHGAVDAGEPAISNCSSEAAVTVTSTMDASKAQVAKAQAPDAELGSKTDGGRAVEFVGGLVGYCAGRMSGCRFTEDGSLEVTTHENPQQDCPTIACGVGGVVGQAGGYVLERETKKKSLFEPFYPNADGTYAADGTVVSISGCANAATVKTTVDGDGGKDRFGEDLSACLRSVGGIVGYAMCNIDDCTNTGTIDSDTGDGSGGVVGSVRGVVVTGSSTAGSDAGCYKPDGADESARMKGPELAVSNCTNNATISGLHAVGGIVGCAGTYTRVSACANRFHSATKPGVLGTRWNKPTSGGVVGQAYGDVDHCYSRANCESRTGAGYYIAGVVGSLARWEKSASADLDSEFPELSSCYTTGVVEGGYGVKAGAICGESSGFIRDCYYLKGNAKDDLSVGDNHAVVNNDTVKAVSNAAELKSKAVVAALNAPTSVAEYEAGLFFEPALEDASGDTPNNGYPVLSREQGAGAKELDASKVSFGPVTVTVKTEESGKAVSKDVEYAHGVADYSSAENPAPKLAVSYEGAELVQGADFFALPDVAAAKADGSCKDVAELEGADLHASVVGMGEYTSGGTGVGSAPYEVRKGDFSTCSATMPIAVFNFQEQTPDASQVSVRDAGGNVVPPESYSYVLNDTSLTCKNYTKSYKKQTKVHDNQEHEGYMFKFTPKEDSNYDPATCTYGYYNIRKGDIADGERASYDGLRFNGQTWLWNMGNVVSGGFIPGYLYRKVDGKEVKGMKVAYTGAEIRPEVVAVKYKDGSGTYHTLEKGKDYRVLYGDPGEASTTMTKDADVPNTNVTSDEVGKRACVTIGAKPGDSVNFTNYNNLFFDIVQADISKDCTVSMPASVKGTLAAADVTVKGYTGATIAKENYTVTTKELSDTVLQVTVKGKKNLKGTYTKNIKLVKTSLAGAKVTLAVSRKTYSGKALKPAVKSVKLAGATLKKGTDYTVNYKKNKNVGKASVVVKGKGAYKGTARATFKIVPKGTKIKKLKVGKKRFTATWKKQAKQTGGYELRYSLKKSMAGAKTVKVKKATTVKKAVKKLKAKKTYYVQVRTFKKVGSATYCSVWSAKKSVKVK